MRHAYAGRASIFRRQVASTCRGAKREESDEQKDEGTGEETREGTNEGTSEGTGTRTLTGAPAMLKRMLDPAGSILLVIFDRAHAQLAHLFHERGAAQIQQSGRPRNGAP